MKKPRHCEQRWSDMKATEGGRLCAKCDKVITDFSSMSWREIEALQKEHQNSLCGMYSKRQLEHWGREIPAKKGIRSFSPTLLLTGALFATEMEAQVTNPHPQTQAETEKKPMEVPSSKEDSIPSIIITGSVASGNSEADAERLAFANIWLKGTSFGTTTDIDGNYRLELFGNPDTLRQKTLVVSYVAHLPIEVTLSELDIEANPINFSLILAPEEALAFYVKSPTWGERQWNKIRSWFRPKH